MKPRIFVSGDIDGRCRPTYLVGLIHTYTLIPSGVQNKFGWVSAPGFAIPYGLSALFLFVLHWVES